MNHKSKFLMRAIWALLFLINIGAAIALNFSSPETPAIAIDLSSTPGWRTISWNNGGTHFYNEQIGLVEKNSDQVVKELPANRFGEIPRWLIFQLIIGTIGFGLVLIKRPQPLGFRHRINVAFGFLIIAWLNLAISAIRLQQEAADNVPVGYVRVALPPTQPTGGLPGVEIVYLLALGLGISILLVYFWIRWERASRPEEFFL
jgi:hypothetical protein